MKYTISIIVVTVANKGHASIFHHVSDLITITSYY